MTWDSGGCEPGLEGTELDPRTWTDLSPDELRALRVHLDDLLDQLRAQHVTETGDEVAARRRTRHECAHCIRYRPHGPSMCPCNPDRMPP